MQSINWRVARRTGFDYVQLTIGATLLALNIALLLVPNKIVSGGATGIATILYYVLGTQVGTMVLIINIPLFIAGVKWGGGMRFAVRTIYATVVMSVLADLFAVWLKDVPPITDPLLFVLYGGLLDGLGMGLVFRGQGTTGGTDVVARLLHHWKGIPFGTTIQEKGFGGEVHRNVLNPSPNTSLASVITTKARGSIDCTSRLRMLTSPRATTQYNTSSPASV